MLPPCKAPRRLGVSPDGRAPLSWSRRLRCRPLPANGTKQRQSASDYLTKKWTHQTCVTTVHHNCMHEALAWLSSGTCQLSLSRAALLLAQVVMALWTVGRSSGAAPLAVWTAVALLLLYWATSPVPLWAMPLLFWAVVPVPWAALPLLWAVTAMAAPLLLWGVVTPPAWAAALLLWGAVPPPASAVFSLPVTPLSMDSRIRIPPLLMVFCTAAIATLLASRASVCMPTPMPVAAATPLAVQMLRGAAAPQAAAMSASVRALAAAVPAAVLAAAAVAGLVAAGT